MDSNEISFLVYFSKNYQDLGLFNLFKGIFAVSKVSDNSWLKELFLVVIVETIVIVIYFWFDLAYVFRLIYVFQSSNVE